jgi:uncharacterized protein
MTVRLGQLLLGLVLVVGLATPARAQSVNYPTQEDTHVNDFADLLSADEETELRQTLIDLQSDQGIELVIVTIDSFRDYRASSIESFAMGLFNRWAIDDVQTNDGVLFLTAVNDRQMRIELGANYSDAMNAWMDVVLDETVSPAYRNNRYEQGILDGTAEIIRRVTNPQLNAIAPTARPSTTFPTTSSQSAADEGSGDAGFIIVIVLLFGGVVLLNWVLHQAGFSSGSSDDNDDSEWSGSRSSSWSSSNRSSGSSNSSSSSSRRSGGGSSRGGGASGKW